MFFCLNLWVFGPWQRLGWSVIFYEPTAHLYTLLTFLEIRSLGIPFNLVNVYFFQFLSPSITCEGQRESSWSVSITSNVKVRPVPYKFYDILSNCCPLSFSFGFTRAELSMHYGPLSYDAFIREAFSFLLGDSFNCHLSSPFIGTQECEQLARL